jgi:hypothetical protein
LGPWGLLKSVINDKSQPHLLIRRLFPLEPNDSFGMKMKNWRWKYAGSPKCDTGLLFPPPSYHCLLFQKKKVISLSACCQTLIFLNTISSPKKSEVHGQIRSPAMPVCLRVNKKSLFSVVFTKNLNILLEEKKEREKVTINLGTCFSSSSAEILTFLPWRNSFDG